LDKLGILNSTFVFFTTDHGYHLVRPLPKDHRQIILWAVIPVWFWRMFPQEAASLERNTKRHTTHRDLYWTIRHLHWLFLPETTRKRSPLNIPSHSFSSTDIPENRIV
jgi:arylsulfatase A-like enzyme